MERTPLPPRAPAVARSARVLPVVAAAALLVISAAAEVARWVALGDRLTSFRFHCVLASPLVLALCVWQRRRGWAAITAIVLVANSAAVAPLYLAGTPAADPDSPRLRVAHVNAQSGPLSIDALSAFLRAEHPDVMVVLDPDAGWVDRVGDATLPLDVVYPLPGDRGRARVLVLASVPVRDVGLPGPGALPGDDGLPGSSVAMTLDTLGTPVRLLALHTTSPTTPGRLRQRDRQLRAATHWITAQDLPVVVVGDFNATPWSHRFRRMLAGTDLVDSGRGRGYRPTWPSILGFAGIPIDHALHDRSLAIARRELGPDMGSQHRSLVVDVALARDGGND